MRNLLKLFIMILFASSSGASDEPTRYVYDEFDINNASKYTISTGDMHEWTCLFNQAFYFMNIDDTPISIDLYKKKVYWVDMDLNTKIKNNYVKLEISPAPEQLFELIHKDDELIFRMKTPHQGSTLVCDFPFKELGIEIIEYTYNSEGQKSSSKIYKDGKWFGVIGYGYYENGQINWEVYKKWDKNYLLILHGKYTLWYENGQIKFQGNFKDGKKEGKLTWWYDNGQIESEQNWKDGKKEGKLTWWDDNGQIKNEQNWKDNIPEGNWTSWFENGLQSGEGSFKDGTGTFLQLHENNQKSYEVIYKDGLGKRTRWHENGRIKFEGNYKDGKENGKVTEWNESGQIKSEKYYKDGECISGDC